MRESREERECCFFLLWTWGVKKEEKERMKNEKKKVNVSYKLLFLFVKNSFSSAVFFSLE